MKISSMGYCVKQGFKNIHRNRLFSLASVATMSACIFLFSIFFSVVQNMQYMIKEAQKNTCITCFFEIGISNEQIQSIGNRISQLNHVITPITYTSPEEAWEHYKKVYFKDKMELAEGFENDNPLANSASFTIYIDSADALANVSSIIENMEGVRSVKKSEITANVFTDISGLVSLVSVVTILILFLVAWFLISNTVSVGISVRKEEIAIMKLLGAKNGFVKMPFLVEGIIIGLVGAMLPMVMFYYLYENVVTYIAGKFTFLSNILIFLPIKEVMNVLLPISIVLGMGIGFLASSSTIKKHLKV